MKLIFIFIALAQLSCGTITINKTIFESQGLLAGRISIGDGISKIKIGEITYRFEDTNGFFAIPLNPGEHHATLIQKQFGGVTTSYQIDRKFKIQKGRVTNFGQVFVLKEDLLIKGFQPPSDAVNATPYFYLNLADVTYYLRKAYPEILAKLRVTELIEAPGPFLSAKQLENLRKAVFNRSMNTMEKSKFLKQRIFTGDIGTIATYQVSKNGQISNVSIIENDSLSTPKCVSYKFGYGACLKQTLFKETQMISIRNHKIRIFEVPKEVSLDNYLEMLDDDYIIFMNPDFFFYFTFNGGGKWRPYRKFIIPSNVGFDLKFARSDKGLYIYSPNSPKPQLIYLSFDGKDFLNIELGKDVETNQLFITKEGLYFGPHEHIFGADTIDFKPHESKAWKNFKLPENNCNLQVSDSGPLHLNCKNKNYFSVNNGTTWNLKE